MVNEGIKTIQLFSAQAITQNNNVSSVDVDLRKLCPNYQFSVGYVFTGTGTLKLEYLVASKKDGTFAEPAGASDIAAALTAGNGTISFSPVLAPFLKIKATENNVGAITALDLWLNVQ